VLEAGGFAIPVDLFAGMAYRVMERPRDARAAFTAARDLLADRLARNPEDHRLHASLGLALAGLGEAEDAVRHGRRAVALYPRTRDALEAPLMVINLALIQTLVGDVEAALTALEQALSVPSILSAAWLEADPRWDPIREAPGFSELLARHRLDAAIR
jgi:tetratricopeptide (TPR) repeat protein